MDASGPSPDRVHVTVQGRGLDEALTDLEDAGLEVEESLTDLGIVTGRATPEVVERLRDLDGVTVEPEADVQLPPPDAPVQ